MTYYADDRKIGSKSIQFLTPTSNSIGIDVSIYLLEIIIKIGKHFPIILLSSASLNILLATNDLLADSLFSAVLNLAFASGNFIFLVQMHQRRKVDTNEFGSVSVDSVGEMS